MSDESKSALMANAELREELALQSVGVRSLLNKYNKQDETLNGLVSLDYCIDM